MTGLQDSFAALAPYLHQYGYAAVFGSLMLESFGLPLPGETALIAGAALAVEGELHIAPLLGCAWLAAVLGDNLGFALGHFGGRRLILRYGAKVGITEPRLAWVEAFFDRFGGEVVLIARFFAIARQLNGIVAGSAGMGWWRFVAYNAIGAALWVGAWGLGVYLFGQKLAQAPPWIHRFGYLALGSIALLAVGAVLVLLARRRGSDPADEAKASGRAIIGARLILSAREHGGGMATIFLSHAEQMRRDYYGDEALDRLRQLGEVRLNDTGRALAPDQLIELARGCEVIVSDRMTEGPAVVFEGLPDLAAFVRCAVDIRNVDVGAASTHGVLVTRASPGFVDSVAELAVGMMVDLARGVADATLAYRAGTQPQARMGRQLRGRTLGIIGYGHIGTRLAQLGQALGMRLMVSDPYVRVVEHEIRQTDLGTLLVEADFVVVLAVATEETEKLIGPEELGWMKPSAYLVNVSRGNLIDEAALATALREGRIAGCAMDVGRAPDQMPSPELARLPNVVATPHIGGLVPEAIAHQALETTRQVEEILKGRAPPGAVNPEHAAKLGRLA